MSVLLYAISRDDARAPAATELHEICAAGLRALTEPVQEPLSAGLEELVHYEETVEAVMRGHTILPMRFGSVADDEQAVRELLTARAREFATALARLDGAVEFGVQASVMAGSSAAATGGGSGAAAPGTSYMQAQLEEHRRRRELQGWLAAALEGVVRDSVYRVTPVCGRGSIGAAYLVDRAGEEAFLTRIEELDAATDDKLSWSGPWPPYSFVEGLEP